MTQPTPELLARHERPGPRYTSYPPIPFWSEAGDDARYRAALEAAALERETPVALYVHLPFCAERCAYCGCNATVTRRADVVDRYLDRIEREIAQVAAHLGSGRPALELHLGGGTPNFLSEAQLRRLLDVLEGTFLLEGAERSIEIDPRISSRDELHRLGEMGFARLSLGVQDFDPRVQEAIGRLQPEALTASLVAAAKEAGFRSVNLDLVHGLPYQDPSGFRRTLERIVALEPDRVSCFAYAHLPHLRPNQKRVDARGLPATAWDRFLLFREAVTVLTDAGYRWIGMDHFARVGDPLTAAWDEGRLHRNFMGYVERAAPHLVAFGSSAIGEVAGYQVQADAHLGRWQRALDEGRLPVQRGHVLTPEDRRRREAIHALLCTLRLPDSLLDGQTVTDEGGEGWLPPLTAAREALDRHSEAGLLVREEGGIAGAGGAYRVTDLGRWFLRTLCMELDGYLPESAPAGPAHLPRFSLAV